MSKKEIRAVIVSGARTPFVRSFAEFTKLDTIKLGTLAAGGLLDKVGIKRDELDAVYWGGVVLPALVPNIGREILLDLGLPTSIEAFTVSRACSTSLLACTLAAAAIERGEAEAIIAGGSDSVSNAPVTFPSKLVQTLGPVAMNKKAGLADWLGAAAQLAPFTDLLPGMPRVAERSTGQLMGEAAEEMSRRNNIGRREQDEFAVASHVKAAAAIESGRFDREIVEVQANGRKVYRDTIVRGDATLEKLAKLRPAFAKNGTLTAANSSALTDGAAAVLIMSEEKALKLGLTPLACFKSWDYMGVDPADQLLIGPAIAMPNALKKAGLKLQDIDLVDIHEAFAGQVLCVLKALESEHFAKERLGLDAAVGKIDPGKLNVRGGSIAIGHPFAATGARMVMTMANELHLMRKKTALLGICAAGGLGAAAVLEAI